MRWRRRSPLIGAGVALACACAFAATSAGVASAGSKPLSISLLTTSQQQILDSGSLQARVFSRRSGRFKVRVSISGSDAGAGGQTATITNSRKVRFKRGHVRNVRLRLNSAGAGLVASCRSQRLALVVKGKRGHGRKLKSLNAVDLARDSGACKVPSSTNPAGGGASGGGGDQGPGDDEPPGGTYDGPPFPNPDRCDPLDPADCLYPWPNDFFTIDGQSTPTGKRLNLNLLSMPTNKVGVPILPGDYNVADGFSPGNMIITKVQGLDSQQAFQNSGLVPITDMARYADPDQAAVVINADTGQRQPIWAEIDANPTNDADKTLIIRPARNFDEGGHYIVALRNLKDASGNPIEPNPGFQVYRDRLITQQQEIEDRRPHMEELFSTLQAAGIKRLNLYSAWDFTVSSRQNLTERARSIRDDAFHQLHDDDLADMQVAGDSPGVSVDAPTDPGDPNIAREVTGTVTVPCYLNAPGCPPGSTFQGVLGSDGLPHQIPGNTASANFRCEIPQSASSANPSRVSLYGHGLLGSADEVGAGNVKAMANEHNITFCATDWAGFSTTDVPSVLLILQDLNQFPKLVDRTQQGFVNFLYLGRALINSGGLSTNSAFRDGGGSLIDTSHLYYDGNSQGGILGGALTALAPDFNRAVLGVPAMNYSTLLQRSTDFRPYAEGEFTSTICDLFPSPLKEICNLAPQDTPLGLYDNYPNELQRPLIFSIMQLLWDRGEPDGYAHHMTTDPLPNTPPHEVLMHPAFGDHQVANVAAEVEARTIGASTYRVGGSPFFPTRSPDVTPLFGIPSISSFPYDGSAIVYYDGGPPPFPGGTTPPPTTDTPPVNGLPGNGADPHSYPRSDIKARAQKSGFLMPNGVVNNYCTVENNTQTLASALALGGTPTPCYSNHYLGPP